VCALRDALQKASSAKNPATGNLESKLKQDGQREERWADGTVAMGQYSYGKKRSRWVERAAFLGAVDWVSFDLSPLSTRFSNEDRARQRHMKPRWSAQAHQ